MIKVTIEDKRNIGCGINVDGKGQCCFICFDTVLGFYLNTYGKVVYQKDFKLYLDEVKFLTKEVKRLNRVYGY
jgi:hypothetical protein